MLALDELFGIAIARGGVIPRRDGKPDRDRRAVLNRRVRHESRKGLGKMYKGPVPLEQDNAHRA